MTIERIEELDQRENEKEPRALYILLKVAKQ